MGRQVLRGNEREIVNLREQGLTQQEIADMKGCSRAAVAKAEKRYYETVVSDAPKALAKVEHSLSAPDVALLNPETNAKRRELLEKLEDLIDRLHDNMSLDPGDVKAFVAAVSAAEKILRGQDESQKVSLTYNDMRSMASNPQGIDGQIQEARFRERRETILSIEKWAKEIGEWENLLRYLSMKEAWDTSMTSGDVIDVPTTDI